jgi:hypothetical protein
MQHIAIPQLDGLTSVIQLALLLRASAVKISLPNRLRQA